MKSTFITIVFIFFISTFVLAYLCSTTVLDKSVEEKISKKERLHLFIPFTFVISVIIYIATLDIFSGFLTLCIFLGVFFSFLFILDDYLRDFEIIAFTTGFSIALIIISIINPIQDTKPEKISEEVIKLEKYTDSSENTVVIELIEDKEKLYAIMGYDKKIDISFILHNEDISNYEISEEKEEKLVITKFETKSYNALAYLGFTKPTVNYYSEYNLYLNKDSIKYD